VNKAKYFAGAQMRVFLPSFLNNFLEICSKIGSARWRNSKCNAVSFHAFFASTSFNERPKDSIFVSSALRMSSFFVLNDSISLLSTITFIKGSVFEPRTRTHPVESKIRIPSSLEISAFECENCSAIKSTILNLISSGQGTNICS